MPEKPKITKIHLLVHPFYGLKEPPDGWHADPSRKMNYETYRPDLDIDYKRYQKYLAGVWGQLLLRVASNPEEAIVYVPLKWKVSRESRFLIFLEQTLGNVFTNKMPMRHIDVKDIDFVFAKNAVQRLNSRFDIDWSKVQLEAHGEMANVCVRQFTERFALASEDRELFDQALRIIDKPNMKDSRVSIGQETTELAKGKDVHLVKHTQLPRTPENKRTQKREFRKRLIRINRV